MPTYVSLIRFTQKGIESIKEGPARLDRAKQAFRAAGGELKAFYLVTGRYDAVAVSEMPNDEAVARVALANASMGNVSRRPRGPSPRMNTGKSSPPSREQARLAVN